MRIALIATVFNEADNLTQWWKSIVEQTLPPDEIVIVDGGSRDGTWEKLQDLAQQSPVPVKLEQRPCNIAEGRNRAIALTQAEIIVCTDAGSFPAPDWLQQITRPLIEDPTLDAVGGQSFSTAETEFQKFLRIFESGYDQPQANEGDFASSRNIAFRRQAWTSVGGYPEWLTLAGEDALFNLQLRLTGKKLLVNQSAIVHWEERPTAAAFFKLLYRNGFGAAEAQLYAPYFLRRLLIVICPLLLLLSHHRFRYLGFRYRKNFSSASGWLAGILKGRRPPPGWRKVQGVLLSPEAQLSYREPRQSHARSSSPC